MKPSHWLTWLGVAIAITGVVAGIWMQVALHWPPRVGGEAVQRWELAATGISMIGFGALLAVAAQILGVVHAARVQISN